jgi:hypothetical protein
VKQILLYPKMINPSFIFGQLLNFSCTSYSMGSMQSIFGDPCTVFLGTLHPWYDMHVETFCRCDEEALEESLCKRVIATRGESIVKNLDARAAALSRDALARIVYSRLFDWLVNKINTSIGQDPSSKLLIGVLDIYGFESFKTNRCLTGMLLHLVSCLSSCNRCIDHAVC